MRIAALEQQKSLRDLAGLPRLCDDVAWYDAGLLASADDPALIVGLWLFDNPGKARKLIEVRSEAGLTTIVVPRFRVGDLRDVLKAPSSVRLKTGEYDAFQWNDNTRVEIAGQTVIETTLHKCQWGNVTGLGVTVLAFRAHEAAGWIVLCTAGVTSRKFGIDVEAQRWLLREIIKRTSESVPSQPDDNSQHQAHAAESVIELLVDDNAISPVVVLAVALSDGRRDAQSVADTLKRIGFELSNDAIGQILFRLPDQSTDEFESALRRFGWGSYLRRGRLVLAEAGVK